MRRRQNGRQWTTLPGMSSHHKRTVATTTLSSTSFVTRGRNLVFHLKELFCPSLISYHFLAHFLPFHSMPSKECVELFRKRFGENPKWLVRCPGRVNLIGEHIDYCDYSVLPMAIEDSTWVAVGDTNERKVHLDNVDKKYAPFTLDISNSFEGASANGEAPKWQHYFLAGWRGILENLAPEGTKTEAEVLAQATGMRVVVGSQIPPSAGLSSSSALVCAAALATLCVQTAEGSRPFERMSKKQLAEIATSAERYAGMEGGGMDQACECLAERGSALRIDFRPLHWTKVELPSDALFAVLHSGVEMNKAAGIGYNQRVVECRIAAQVIAKRAGCLAAPDEWQTVRTLREAATKLDKGDSPAEMLQVVDMYLKKDDQMGAHTRDEVCAILGCTDAELAKWSLNANTQKITEFWLAKRAKHVYAEAARVMEFERVCRSEQGMEAIQKLGALMNASHKSCAELYECSCPELDEVVKACLKAGCLGARLTGAGWGGCAVALVDKAHRASVEASGLKVLFWSEPCEGIEAYPFNEGN